MTTREPWRDWTWTYNPRTRQCSEPTHQGFEVVAWDPDDPSPYGCEVVAIFREEIDAKWFVGQHHLLDWSRVRSQPEIYNDVMREY